MKIIVVAAIKNIPAVILILYAKFFSHAFIAHHANGKAISTATKTSFKKSLDNIIVILFTDAPTTFLMPISFCLFCAVKAASPNNPRQEMIIAIVAKYLESTATFSSDEYIA